MRAKITRALIVYRLTHWTCMPTGDGMFRVATREEAASIADIILNEA